VQKGSEGIEVKSSLHPGGWQGHNPEDNQQSSALRPCQPPAWSEDFTAITSLPFCTPYEP